MLNIGIKVTDSDNDMIIGLLKEMASSFNSKLPSITNFMTEKLKVNLIKSIIRNTPEYQAIAGGPLNTQFGLEPGTEQIILSSIIDALNQSLRVISTPLKIQNKKFVGGISVQASKQDYSDVLGIPEAFSLTTDGVFPWLQWLLFEGDTLIIANFEFSLESLSNNQTAWRVPVQYSGTKDNNWITRAIDNNKQLIEQEIISSFRQAIDRFL